MPEDKEFLEQLKTHSGGFGSIIKNLITDSPRILINFPIMGRARKISAALEDQPFSILYKYERTLANKLHPFLYRHNLNYITNSRIEGFFHKKFNNYEALLPRSFEEIRESSYDEKLQALSSLKRTITAMSASEGHFMVIKFYDYIYSTINRGISDFLRSVEFKLNFLKPRLTEDDEANLNLVRKKYREFKNIFNDHDAELLIERMKWDPLLVKYALLIEKEEEKRQNGSSPLGKIERYASLLKKKHLDLLEENDTDGIRRVVDAVTRSNKEQHGDIKAASIIDDIINSWLNMDSLSEEKKKSIRSMTGRSPSDEESSDYEDGEAVVQLTAGEPLSAEEMADEIFQNTGIDLDKTDTGIDSFTDTDDFSHSDEGSFSVTDELLTDDSTGFDITEESNSEFTDLDIFAEDTPESDESFNLTDAPDSGAISEFTPADAADSKLTNFDIAEEDPSDTAGFFDSAEKTASEAKDDFAIAHESASEREKLFALVEKNITRLTESARLKAEAFDISTLQAQEISTLLNSEILRETRPGFLASLEHSGDDVDLFLKIIRYLENGPFPDMTLREKVRLMDIFIDKFKKNIKLNEKLVTYRNTMTSRQSLLDEIFTSLHTIKKTTPDKALSTEKQLQYLRERLVDDNFSPVWRTLQVLYENIVVSDPVITCSLLSKTLPGNQVELFNKLKTIDKTPELHKKIDSMLASENLCDGNERYIREQEKSPDSPEEIIRQVMKEDIDLDSWIKKIGSGPQTDITTGSTRSLPTDAAGIKESIKELLTKGDWSNDDTEQKFSDLLKSLVDYEKEKSLPFFEKILSHDSIPCEAHETVLETLRDSSSSLLQDVYTAHRFLETSPTTETEANIINSLMDRYGESLPRGVIEDMKKFTHVRAENLEGSGRALKIIAEQKEDLQAALSIIAADVSTPPAMQNYFTALKDHLTAENIEQAIQAITGSASSPDLKADLLEKLKQITLGKNVSPDDPLIQKIEKKISFYKRISVKSEKNKKNFRQNSDKLISGLRKKPEKQDKDETVTAPAKRIKPGENKTADSQENSLLDATYSLLKVFSDNIDSLEPVLGALKDINNPEEQQSIDQEIQGIRHDENRMLSATLDMISAGELNIELLSEIQKISPRAQYQWATRLQEKKEVKKFENAFSNFLRNKKLPDELNRLVRVIYSNNQNNFLKDSLDRENKLIKDIAADFTDEGLKKLRSKTRNRQDKDRINLFRDILKMAEGSIGIKNTPPQAPPDKRYKDNIAEKISTYISSDSNKSEKVRQASLVHVKDFNNFFQKAAALDKETLGVINQHPEEFTELFSYILRQKKDETFPAAKNVIKYCLSNGIIRREDL